jgi:hypothetical protein
MSSFINVIIIGFFIIIFLLWTGNKIYYEDDETSYSQYFRKKVVDNKFKDKRFYFPPLYTTNQFSEYCEDIKTIEAVQRFQFRKARQEVFGHDGHGTTRHNDEIAIYSHNYGSISIDISDTIEKKISTLSYFAIWRNGHKNITSHLKWFSSLYNSSTSENCPINQTCSSIILKSIEEESKTKERKKKLTKKEKIINKLKHNKTHGPPSILSDFNNSRFAFAFIRDPVKRFVSGYSELEYRLNNKKITKDHKIPTNIVLGKLGSQRRFKEFFRVVLHSTGSKDFLRDLVMDFKLIAPQIGSLIDASKKEFKITDEIPKIHLYRIEAFNEEWNNIANDSQFQRLSEIGLNKTLPPFKSSYDPLNTTKRAWELLLPSLEEKKTIANGDSKKSIELQDESIKYLKAICRIYLVDYICTGYELPLPCQHLQEELQELLSDHLILTSPLSLFQKILNIPIIIRYYLAQIYCFRSSTPECVITFTYGESDFDDENDL